MGASVPSTSRSTPARAGSARSGCSVSLSVAAADMKAVWRAGPTASDARTRAHRRPAPGSSGRERARVITGDRLPEDTVTHVGGTGYANEMARPAPPPPPELGRAALLDLDPELGASLPEEERARAAGLVVQTLLVEPGPWNGADPGGFAMLVA